VPADVDRRQTMPGFHTGRPPRNKGLRYLQCIGNAEIIEIVHARRAPMIAVSASLRL
jgi:hypothetical protein